MRNLERNKQELFYLNYVKTEKVLDSNNPELKTGEKRVVYTKAIKIKAHVSGAKGSSMVEVFGTDISYDKTILLTKNEFAKSGINENSVFFIDTPVKYIDNVPLYDYEVKRIANTPNEVLIAVKRVSANESRY